MKGTNMNQTIDVKPTNISFGGILKESENQVAVLEEKKGQVVSAAKRNGLFIVGTLGALFLIGMMAANIIAGVFALIVAFVGGAALLWGYRALKAYDPVIRQKMLNHVYDLQIQEARDNAIIQLDRAVITSEVKLNDAREARDEIGGQVNKLKEKAKGKNDADGFYARTIENLEAAYLQIKSNVDRAAKAHSKFKERVRMYHDRYEFSKSANKIQQLMGASGADEMAEMLTAAAFDEIDSEFNTALVAIENLAHDNKLDAELKENV